MRSIDAKHAVRRICAIDPQLVPYRRDIIYRIERRNAAVRSFIGKNGKCTRFADAYRYFGFHCTRTGWTFREWLPGADEVHLIGDFNGWDHSSHPLQRLEDGIWEIRLARRALQSGQHVKLWIRNGDEEFERIPAYIFQTETDPDTYRLCGIVSDLSCEYPWTDGEFYGKHRIDMPLIYEVHIGMAQEREGIGTYREFADGNLTRIARLGYNCIQLMAVQEHPYYASFGYQVTSLFAPSCRFGTPDDLRYLIDRAHALGLSVLLDVVHSHACPNTGEGLHLQDGTPNQYFLPGERGWHAAWGTRIYDYGKKEVVQFLLSNLKYWQEQFHFDGFRFDGVTSMLYESHGLGECFTSYDAYYSLNTNIDAMTYLELANELIHTVNPNAVTVAEEMSGMPGVCLAPEDGGLGFDYRLAMGVPDYWVKLVKDTPYEAWDMHRLWYELTTLRPGEGSIGYCESHDQALVGDKTLIFRMLDSEMYTGMCTDYHSLSMDIAIDYHKLIRFVTLTLSGNGYLTFMGNEFGHPEWIDFPREGNGWSHRYARRQWSLASAPELKYHYLERFEAEMLAFAKKNRLLCAPQATCLSIDQERKTLTYARGGLLFAISFHTSYSEPELVLDTLVTGRGRYRVIFTSDGHGCGGQERVDREYIYESRDLPGGKHGLTIYLPCRTAVVLARLED